MFMLNGLFNGFRFTNLFILSIVTTQFPIYWALIVLYEIIMDYLIKMYSSILWLFYFKNEIHNN